LFAEINRIVTIRPLQILKGKSSRSLLHCISSWGERGCWRASNL